MTFLRRELKVEFHLWLSPFRVSFTFGYGRSGDLGEVRASKDSGGAPKERRPKEAIVVVGSASAGFSNNMRELRQRRALSMGALADRIGASRVQILRLERGDSALTQGWIERICPALNCEPNDLLLQPDTPAG